MCWAVLWHASDHARIMSARTHALAKIALDCALKAGGCTRLHACWPATCKGYLAARHSRGLPRPVPRVTVPPSAVTGRPSCDDRCAGYSDSPGRGSRRNRQPAEAVAGAAHGARHAAQWLRHRLRVRACRDAGLDFALAQVGIRCRSGQASINRACFMDLERFGCSSIAETRRL